MLFFLLSKWGLCGAKRACVMADPCSHGSLLAWAREDEPEIGCSRPCGVCLCFGWCCVPSWAHSTSTRTFACSWRPWCQMCVLPRPCARGRAACASRGGLAGERVLGEVRKGPPPIEREGNFFFTFAFVNSFMPIRHPHIVWTLAASCMQWTARALARSAS